jgi:hypothetical protein
MPSGKTKNKQPSDKKPSAQGKSPKAASPIVPVAAAMAGDPPAAVKPAAYDPAIAKAARDGLRALLDAYAADKLPVPRVDVRAAALAALGVHGYVTQHAALFARFEKLAQAGEFEIDNVARLKDAAFVVMLVHAQAEEAGAFATDVKVPASVVEEAMGVERRMQELLEYKFKRDPLVAPLLAALRPGIGYRDLAADLIGYAEIYEQHKKGVASDTTNYRASDLPDARRLAGEILSHLSAAMTPKARQAYEQLQRAWMLLLDVYAEVREAGRWLLRRDPAREDRFPSLVTAGRTAAVRAPKAPKAAPKKEGGEQTEDG